MKVTYNWLKEFVDFDLTPVQLADTLTMLGLEVEAMETQGGGMDEVVVALVEEKKQHPNADKLSLCRVNNGKEVLDVVCGAQNFNQGDTVALAQVGAVLPGDFKIKKSKIRGEVSYGMLCSEKELGLEEESAGILVLKSGLAPLGTPLFNALGRQDTLYEIGLTPNRADCLSTVGIAREIAAKTGIQISYPDETVLEGDLKTEASIGVTIEDPEYCPRYAARFITDCKILPSPAWLVKRLNTIGIRSINNVVDVTNLVMMELGQPLHAFDGDRLAGKRIVVRRAGDGELFTTLDGQQRVLLSSDLVICDAVRPVAIAGVMGGQNSEIEITTTSILLESACFKPAAIRKTSKRLGLHTESSHRFERGVDIDSVTRALNRATALIVELAGGNAAQGCLDVYPGKNEPNSIVFHPERANRLIGIKLSTEVIADILQRIGCRISENSPGGEMLITPPSYRIDIDREIDLIEEVARLNGYDTIPASMPTARVVSDRPPQIQQLAKRVREILVNHGMNEIINFSFDAPDFADKLMLTDVDPRRVAIKLENPLAVEHSIMRTSLLPGVLETMSRNINFRSLDLKLFEMRRVYLPVNDEPMPHEPVFIVGALSGLRDGDGWSRPSVPVDFYDTKGIVESLFDRLSIGGVSFVPAETEQYYHPGKSCRIVAGREYIGSIGEIHPTVLENYRLEKAVYCFELDFEKLIRHSRTGRTVTAPSRFPDSTRDIALLVPNDLLVDIVIQKIKSEKIKEIEYIQVFDVYRGKGIDDDYKSIAIRVRYRSYDRTLTDDEIGVLHGKIINALISSLPVSIR